MEDKLAHSSLTLKEEKEILVTIKQLKSNKVEIVTFENEKNAHNSTADLATLDSLRESRKEKTKSFASMKEEIAKLSDEVSALRAKEEKANAEVVKLIELKKEANDKITELLDEQREARKAFKLAEKAYRDYSEYQAYLRRQKYREEKAARAEEEKAYAEEREREEAARDHWEAEKELANQLITYLKRFLPTEAATEVTEDDFDPSSRRDVEEECSRRNFTEFVRDAEDDSILGGSGSKSKKSKDKKAKKESKKAEKAETKRPVMVHTPDVFAQFDLLDLNVPMNYASVPEAITALEEKLAWFNTNPDKSIKEQMAEERKKRNKGSNKTAPAAEAAPEKAASEEPTDNTVSEVVF